MTNGEDLVETLRRFNLFADLDRAQLEAIADPDSERSFGAGERILRRGMSGSGFYVILDGEATVTLGGEELNRLRQGEFFGAARLAGCVAKVAKQPLDKIRDAILAEVQAWAPKQEDDLTVLIARR